MIKYLGSKRLLIPALLEQIRSVPDLQRVGDLFSGTSRVGHALKNYGYAVFANDHNAYAATLARCYIAADAEDWAEPAAALIHELNALPGEAGWFTRTYSEEARFFQPDNAARIEAMRHRIAQMDLHPTLKAVLLVSLMEAADRVDSTTGVQMAYLKEWSARSAKPIELRLPALLPRAPAGPGAATQLEAAEAAAALDVDLLYLDPPYNQHQYLGNYHIWKTLIQWDQPEVYGVARKRLDCRTRKSPFNRKRGALGALRQVVEAARAPHLLVSFSDEGFLGRAELEALLTGRGEVQVTVIDHPRYVGARIGIYNPKGERVGAVSHTRNQELLYLVTPR